MEAVQWIHSKLIGLGLQAVTGRLEGNPVNQIIVVETDYEPLYSKDTIMLSEKPTVTVVIFRRTQTECYAVFNQIRPIIGPDLVSGVRMAEVVDREIYEYEDQTKMYALAVEIDVKLNL